MSLFFIYHYSLNTSKVHTQGSYINTFSFCYIDVFIALELVMMHGVDMKSCILINSIIREVIYIYCKYTCIIVCYVTNFNYDLGCTVPKRLKAYCMCLIIWLVSDLYFLLIIIHWPWCLQRYCVVVILLRSVSGVL